MIYSIGSWMYTKFRMGNRNASNTKSNYSDKLTLKMGTNIKTINTANIQLITTDKPYTAVHLEDQKILQDKSLKDYEKALDPDIFIRVHRSAIVNKNHIVEMTSRKNGDYDGILGSGESVRFSRHFRENWKSLLQ